MFPAGGKITIGDVVKEMKVPKKPAYVPTNYSKLKNLEPEICSDKNIYFPKNLKLARRV